MNIIVSIKCSHCGRWSTTVSKDGISFCPYCSHPMIYAEGKDGIVILKRDSVPQ